MTHYPYWFTYLYFESKDKWVELGIGNGDSIIRTSTITGPPPDMIHHPYWFIIHTDSLIRALKVRINESTLIR